MNIIQVVSVAILPLIFAITVHEAAHGWLAARLGDPTAKLLGRLTFNPIPHIDPIGTIVVPMVMLVTGGFLFGWAKPVPVNMNNFKHPRRDMAMVALAANLLMAVLWAIIWKISYLTLSGMPSAAVPLIKMAQVGVFLNLALMLLNLLPLPPLDGGRVLAWLVPESVAAQLDKIERYGIFILVGLLFLGLWEYLLGPVLGSVHSVILQLVGVQ